MGVLDFLFEGTPPPSATTSKSTVTDMPKWLSDYTQGVLNQGAGIAGQPYQAYEGPRLAGLTPDQLQAYDVTRNASGSYNPAIQGAQATAGGALTAAQPYFNQAGQTLPSQVQSYMDPYVENVIDRAGTLTQRQLDEKLLPSVARVFGGAGATPRSTQMRATVDRGVRDLTEGLQEQALGALSGAYQTAGNQFQADASRMGTLGQNVGALSLNQAQTQAGLANTQQQLQLRDAAALAASGQEQQQDTQKSLDLAKSDFDAQRDYPKTQLDWFSNLVNNARAPSASTSTEVAPSTAGVGPSKADQLGSLVSLVSGLMKDNGNARGGRIHRSKYARGGALRYVHG